jgi:long-chain acyl-CoA synthetase
MPLLLQGTAAALRQAFHPRQLLDDAAATGATVFPGVPFMFQGIRELGVDRLPPRLRLLITAGARIDPATVHWFHDRVERKVHSFYGSSETGGISYDESDDVSEPLHLGRAMPETTIEIVDPDPKGIGRIVVSGSAVAFRYGASASAEADSGFADGRFITTDLGYLSGDGRLVMTGRRSSLVNVAGRKVDPAEVERVLAELPGVIDARVIGAACDRRGQQLVAFVVSASDRSSVALRQGCAKLLSPHKIPRRFIFLDRLPVDARGKMDRRALEALATAEPA